MQTSWSPVAKWYGQLVGESGHYYHQHVILPKLKSLLDPQPGESVLDVGCGQGVYARTLQSGIKYTGIDSSPELINSAKKLDPELEHSYFVADATISLPVSHSTFDHAVCILALQNMSDGSAVITNVHSALKPGGDFTFVLNHPCFRIPRQTSWGTDTINKLEYRRINRYLSPLNIPVNAHPGLKNSPVTWSYHQPISYFFSALKSAGMVVTDLGEWGSDKKSVGKNARAENRARTEFPLFLSIKAVKLE